MLARAATAAAPAVRLARGTSGARALSSSALADRDAVIVSTARTPIGSIGGALASLSAPQLGSEAIKGALAKVASGLNAADVEEVFMGNVVSAGTGQAPARQAALGAGLTQAVPCTTINKVCASGMKTVMFAAQSVATGYRDVVVAGGMESMTNTPHYLPGARAGMPYGHGQVVDGIIKDGLWDVYNDQHMGVCAEKCASDYSLSREEQDRFALQSYARAAQAWEEGRFADEVVPVSIKQRRGDPKVVDRDEEFGRLKAEKVPTLATAFKRDGGTVTAANASSLNDGAAALVVMSAAAARDRGLTPLARIRGYGDAAQAPEDFTTAPALAVPRALAHAGVSAGDIEYHEVNEAFAVVVLANAKLLGLDEDRINVNGGAVALGHPIGMSGARIISSLITVLTQNDATLGTASICNGGGGASAIVIERL